MSAAFSTPSRSISESRAARIRQRLLDAGEVLAPGRHPRPDVRPQLLPGLDVDVAVENAHRWLRQDYFTARAPAGKSGSLFAD